VKNYRAGKKNGDGGMRGNGSECPLAIIVEKTRNGRRRLPPPSSSPSGLRVSLLFPRAILCVACAYRFYLNPSGRVIFCRTGIACCAARRQDGRRSINLDVRVLSKRPSLSDSAPRTWRCPRGFLVPLFLFLSRAFSRDF